MMFGWDTVYGERNTGLVRSIEIERNEEQVDHNDPKKSPPSSCKILFELSPYISMNWIKLQKMKKKPNFMKTGLKNRECLLTPQDV